MKIQKGVDKFVQLVLEQYIKDDDKYTWDEIADMYDTNSSILTFLDELMKLNKILQSSFSDEELDPYSGRFDHYDSDVDGVVILFDSSKIQIAIMGKVFLVSLTGMLKMAKDSNQVEKKRFIFEISQKKKDDTFFPVYKKDSTDPLEIESRIERFKEKIVS